MSAPCGSECNGTWPGPEPRRAFHVRGCPNDPVPHDYLSTACHHGLHDKCRLTCKFCLTDCGCSCHHVTHASPDPGGASRGSDARFLRPVCGNPDHVRDIDAVALVTWPDGQHNPAYACRSDLRWLVREAVDRGARVLVERAPAFLATTASAEADR